MNEKLSLELEQLKKTLQCLVISSATVTDVRSLSRDFLNIEGERIPHIKFGYTSLLDFLKERCNDCLLFSGDPRNPILTPVVTERTKHINDLVSRQKIPSTAKVKLKRSSVLENNVTPNRQPCRDANRYSNPREQNNRFSASSSSRSSTEVGVENWRVRPSAPTNIQPQKLPETPMRPIVKNNDTYKTRDNTQANMQPTQWPETPHRSVFKENDTYERRENTQTTKGAIPKVQPTVSDQWDIESSDNLSKSMDKLSLNSKYNALYLNKTKSQLQELMHYNPNGIWLDELNDIYSKKFEDGINFSRVGYCDIASLCRDMGDVVRLQSSSVPGKLLVVGVDQERTTNDIQNTQRINTNNDRHQIYEEEREYYEKPRMQCEGPKILHDRMEYVEEPKVSRERSKVHSEESPPPIKDANEVRGRSRRQQELDLSGDSDDALPGVPYDDGIFPEDCIGRKESIAGVRAQDLEPGSMCEVNISEVLDPSHFWFQLRSDEHDLALEALMDEMDEYYEKGEGKTRVMEPGAVQVGQYCATKYEPDGWHRSVIVRIIDTDYVKIRQVDYGTVTRVARTGLRVLLHKWACLPAQALRGCLANVRPHSRLSYWPHKTSLRFLELVNCVPLVAQVHSVEAANQIVRLYLTDTTKEEDIFLNNILVTESHAEVCDMHRDVSPPPSITVRPPREPPTDAWTQVSSCSDLSESASAIVDRPPKRMKEWEPPDEAVLSLGLKRLLLVQKLMNKMKQL